MKFLHAADIHLDSPLRGLDRYEGAPVDEIRGATRRALENLVSLAIEEEVDFVVLAGDLFDGDWPDFNTGLFFVRQMSRLGARSVPVYAVRGNHDAESKITRKLPWPENVHFFSTRKPETVVLDGADVALHGQSFPNQRVVSDLAATYPAAVPGKLNIGILHTSLDGREGHDTYAPTRVEVLKSKGYEYWALGHVHKREVLNDGCVVVFPGNSQGRHIKEIGSKGCELVTLEGPHVRSEHRPLDVLRWYAVDVDVNGAADLDAVLARTADAFGGIAADAEERLCAVRVSLVGRSNAFKEIAANPDATRQQIRAVAIDRGAGRMWIEKVRLRTSAPIDLATVRGRQDPIGELARQMEAWKSGNTDLHAAFANELQALKQKLPAEIAEGVDGLRLDDPVVLQELMSVTEPQILSRIMDAGGSE